MKVLVLTLLVACAPSIDGPVERGRTADKADADRLAVQLQALPGVVRSEVMLRRPVRDPLGTAPAVAPTASLVVIVDDKADRAAVAASARSLAKATAPELEPVILVEVGAVRPELTKVGPFTVEAGSRGPLRAMLGIALVAILGLAGYVAFTSRRRR
ncbi:MAG: hypothetical protein ABI867_32520 [Kofleriaceae bacterium]